MKKFQLFALFFALLALSINTAKAQIYPKGSVNVSVGYGAFPYGNIIKNLLESRVKDLNFNRTGPIYVKAEYALADNFTLGLNINYTNLTGSFSIDSVNAGQVNLANNYSGTVGLRSTSFIGRLNYTIPFADDKAGFMIGGGIGYRGFRGSYKDNDPKTPVDGGLNFPFPLTGELTFGLRYYLTENIGLYTEFGLTRSILQGGITARF
jgi:Outer membrane protein beta-barrel domain